MPRRCLRHPNTRKSLDRLRTLGLLLMISIPGVAGVAPAAITGANLTGGQALTNGGTVLQFTGASIPDIVPNGFNDDNVRIFDEQQNLTLATPVPLDVADSSLISNVLGPGSVVSSHYLFYDSGNGGGDAIGTVTFDQPILGLIRLNQQHDLSDPVLGDPGVVYGVGNPSLESSDVTTFSGNTLDFDMTSANPGDALRIVTGVNPVPGVNVCDTGSETLAGVITGGAAASAGGTFRQICDPIGDVGDDNFQSYDLFAFEEQQNVLLDADLFLDSTTIIASGETVSSFYVIFDPGPNTGVEGTIDFPSPIIGLIRDRTQLQNSEFLGDASANYLSPSLLGLESGDSVTFSGNQLTVDVRAGTPGDSIRVLLGSASPSLTFNPCEPAAVTLSGTVTGGAALSAGGIFVELCPPIGPVGNDNYQTADLYAFRESTGVILDTALSTDAGPLATIPAGTPISSYYVAFDPSNSLDTIGSVHFPRNILGVMTSTGAMIDSDLLGAPSGVYLNPNLRGLEAAFDSVSVIGSTLSVDLSANSPGDYVRVIVEADPPAVPGLSIFGLGLTWLLMTGTAIAFISALPRRRQASD